MIKLTAVFLTLSLLTACTPAGSVSASRNEPPAGTKGSTATPKDPTASSTSAVSGEPLGEIPVIELGEQVRTSTEGLFDWRGATVYYAMTDRFHNGDEMNDESYGRKTADANGSKLATFNGGDFKGLTEKLESGYFSELGVNALWVSAPYEQIHGFVGGGEEGEFAHYGFHGYYPLDWTMTDRNFGTRDEFQHLVDTAHEKGIRIIMDVVMNHAGYHTVQDMEEYSFGVLNGIAGSWQPEEGQSYHAYHEFIDYSDEEAWMNWWGPEWVRAGLPGYERGGSDDLSQTLAGLPDIKTESTHPAALPPLLKTKWEQEKGAEYEPYRIHKAEGLRQDLQLAPAGYISAWLTAWVEEFGIDGFRIDTAKHVEMKRWIELKASAQEALDTWREENPEKAGADFSDPFFMVGEVWGAGIERNDYYDAGFDALINFTFQGAGSEGPAYRQETMPRIFQRYGDTLDEQDINVLSYLSSHDTRLFQRSRLKEGLTYLLLLPGAVEIFYGDETGRTFVPSGRDIAMGTRSYMNWDSVDEEVLKHVKIFGSFRARNLAVGSGRHTELSKEPFIFQRDYVRGDLTNTVVVAFNQEAGSVIDVSRAFQDGALLRDAATMRGYEVTEGKVTVVPDDSGIVLLEKVE